MIKLHILDKKKIVDSRGFFTSCKVGEVYQLLGHFIVGKNSALVRKNTSYQRYIRLYVGTLVIPSCWVIL